MNLYQHSLAVILKNQHASGAFIASPNFPTYAYSWFRDGSYIAYALDRAGQHDSARKFHLWCARVIERQASRIASLIAGKESGKVVLPEECLPARYTLEGWRTGDEWTDFQLDGYGTWLWSLSEHIRLSNDQTLLAEVKPGLELLLPYLVAFWDQPCYDCWEEHLEAIHPYTLAALHAGLQAVLQLEPGVSRPAVAETTRKIEAFILEYGIHPRGYVRKLVYPAGNGAGGELPNLVDASLTGLAVPFEMPAIAPEVIQSTMQKIEAELCYPGGGVYRYMNDTYYGGGEWILLAAWLGWYWCRNGAAR